MARIVVIGGGLSGLVAAHRLARARHTVLVVEATARFGGQLHTVREDGYVIELGAEGFVARSEIVPKLAGELGIEPQLMGQSVTRSLGYRAGSLRELAPGEAAAFLGFQVSRGDLGMGIRTFRAGMGSLTDTLAQKLSSRVELRCEFCVTRIERHSRDYELRSQDGASIRTDALVLATPARSAWALLSPVIGQGAFDPGAIKLMSSVTVSLVYPAQSIAAPLDATGFVIATEDQWHGARACTFTSSKFEDRAPRDHVSLRVFMRPDARELKTLADSAYAARAAEVIERVLGPKTPALRAWVSRWPDALPVFDDQSRGAIAKLEAALKGSRIGLSGSAFHGAGIDAAVRSAWSIEERL